MRGRVADLPQRLEQTEYLAPAGDARAGAYPHQRVRGRRLEQHGLLAGQLHVAVADHLLRQLGRDVRVGLAAASASASESGSPSRASCQARSVTPPSENTLSALRGRAIMPAPRPRTRPAGHSTLMLCAASRSPAGAEQL